MRAARTNLPILVLEGGYVCLLEELSWNSDARRKGEAADASPDLQSYLSAARAKIARRRQRQARRSPSGRRALARRQGQGGNWRPLYLFLSHPSRPRATPLPELDDSQAHTQGFANGRAGPCYTHPASKTPCAQIRRIKGRTSTLAAGRTFAGSLTRQRRGHGSSRGAPSGAGSHTEPRRPT